MEPPWRAKPEHGIVPGARLQRSLCRAELGRRRFLTTLAGYKAISRKFVMRRWADKRDQAIILTLLDMGLRASESVSLKGL